MVQAGSLIFIMLSTISLTSFSFSPSPVFLVISLVPNLIGIGMNLLYFLSNSEIVLSSRKLFESFEIFRIISVPLSFLSDLTKVNSGEPSHDQ